MKKVYFVLVLFCSTIIMETHVFAYLDPGVTSMLIQAVAGVVIIASASIGIFGKKIRVFFKNLKKKKSSHAKQKDVDSK